MNTSWECHACHTIYSPNVGRCFCKHEKKNDEYDEYDEYEKDKKTSFKNEESKPIIVTQGDISATICNKSIIKWISVDDKLPQNEEPILMKDKYNIYSGFISNEYAYEWRTYIPNTEFTTAVFDVTHWIYLKDLV